LIAHRLHVLAVNESRRMANVATLQIVHSQSGIAIAFEKQIASLLAHAISPFTCCA